MSKTLVLNLKRRPDRKENVENIFRDANFTDYIFYEAIDGKTLNLSLEIKNLFTGNDFGSRKTFIGCALSHYNMWLDLINDDESSYYLIFEDDFYLCNNFTDKLNSVKKILEEDISNIDILFLGYHTMSKNKDFNETDEIIFKKYNNNKYIGGFFSYIITKKGALKIFDYIKKNGIKHGIDYIIKLDNNLNIKEVSPHIVFSDWVRPGNNSVDSDIQKDFGSFDLNQIVDGNNYIFIPNFDMVDNNIKYLKKTNINDLINECNKIDHCEGFNTVGFFKGKVFFDCLKESPWFKDNDGLFVKIDRKIRVKMICDWELSENLCNDWNYMSKGNFTWNDIKITHEDDNIDYCVIINCPLILAIKSTETDTIEYKMLDVSKYDDKKTIIFQMEPSFNKNQKLKDEVMGIWANPDESKFLEVRNHKKYYNNCSWQIKKTYYELGNEIIIKKYDYFSTICSSKYIDDGHILRINFLKFLEGKQSEENVFTIDIYGFDNSHNFINYRRQLSSEEKHIGLYPYKYYFIAENNKEHNYITEKLWEPLLSECLCFYWGADNVSDYINPMAYISLDLNNFEESYQIIKNAIKNDLYSERIEYIKQEKYKILNYYNFFPTIERIITKDLLGAKINNINKKIKIIIIESNSNNIKKLIPFINTLKDFEFTVQIFKEFDFDKLIIEDLELNNNYENKIIRSMKKIIYNNKYIKYCNKKTMNIKKLINDLSHIKNYENLINDDNFHSYLIIEDDVHLECSYKKLFNTILFLPEIYDVCIYGNYEKNKDKTRIINQINTYYYDIKKYYFNDSSSYIVSKSGAAKMLDYTNNTILCDSGELLYKSYKNINDFKLYGIKDFLFDFRAQPFIE